MRAALARGSDFFADLHSLGNASPHLIVSQDRPVPGAPAEQQPGPCHVIFNDRHPWSAAIVPLLPPAAPDSTPTPSPAVGTAERPIPLPGVATLSPPSTPIPAVNAGADASPFAPDASTPVAASPAAPSAASAGTLQACADIVSDLARLQCYDRAAANANPGHDVITR
ncbi:MAG: hypothetical protein M0002_05945 [Rhodospirillales bacterium]|nr:hypothetical protein [Rhodospirillales bacterium]